MKHVLVGALVVLVGAGVAFTQIDTTGTRPDTTEQQPRNQDTMSSDLVARAVICTGVSNHEPTDSLVTVPPTMSKVFFFTEIVGMEGKTITHRWIKDGTRVADIRISVATNRYRCHSSRSVEGKPGDWSVQVLSEDGERLVERSFVVESPTAYSPIGRT